MAPIANRPQICFDTWGEIPPVEICFDTWGEIPPVEPGALPLPLGSPIPGKFLQKGFHLVNDGGAAHEITVESFEIEPSVRAGSKTVTRIAENRKGFAYVWLEDRHKPFDPDRWDLLGALATAYKNKHGDPFFGPDKRVRVSVVYRDADGLWYRSRADLTYVRSQGRLEFGPTTQEACGPKCPLPPELGRTQAVAANTRHRTTEEGRLEVPQAPIQKVRDSAAKTAEKMMGKAKVPKRRDLLESISPEDSNYEIVKGSYLEAWADSHHLVAEAFAGRVSLSDYTAGCVRTFAQGAQLHVDIQDSTPLRLRCREIDRLARLFIKKFRASLLAVPTKFSKDELNAAIAELSRQVNEIGARCKQQIFERAKEPGRPRIESGFARVHEGAGGILSGVQVGTPTLVPQREFLECRHSLPEGPEEIRREFQLLAQEAVILVTRDSSNPLQGVDDWLDRLRSEGLFVDGTMKELLVASAEHLRKMRLYEMRNGHDQLAEQCGTLAIRFGELSARLVNLQDGNESTGAKSAVASPLTDTHPDKGRKRMVRTRQRDPELQRLRERIRSFRGEGLTHKQICDRLGNAPRPPRVTWRDLEWRVAYKQHKAAVTKWLSEACS